MHGERCEGVSAPRTPFCTPSNAQRGAPPYSQTAHSAPRGWGVQWSERLRRWGSLHHIKGVESGADRLEDLLSVKLTLHFPSSFFVFFFPSPLSVRILTAETICHRAHSYRMINTAGEIALSAPRSLYKNHYVCCKRGEKYNHIRHASTRTQVKHSALKGTLHQFHTLGFCLTHRGKNSFFFNYGGLQSVKHTTERCCLLREK